LHQLGHEPNITARAERPTRAGDDHDANTAFTSGVFERFSQIAPHVADERIEPFGPVERNRDDATIFGD
jgi:hypothetical protein